jgi:LEA14-like dessication related protein
MRVSKTLALVLVVASLLALACSKPEPPSLVPKSATITAMSLGGMDLRLQLDAFNPNGFDLTAQRVTAKVTLDGKYDVGVVTANTALMLPGGKSTPLDVPIAVTWSDAAQLATLAAANRPIPYVVNGTAAIGGEKLNVDVPFRIDGVLTPEQLKRAVMKSLPMLPPGLLPAP